MLFDFAGKRAVVTGGGSGIGRSISHALCDRGASLFILDRDGPAGHRVRNEIENLGGTASCVECDVSDENAVGRAFAGIAQEWGRLDILVNSAGIAHIGSVETTEPAELDAVYRVNVRGVFLSLRAGLPLMKASGGGSIVNIASTASLAGIRQRFAYSMSKGAVLSMTMSVAADYVRDNIRCNCVCPARVHTPFVDGYLRQHYPGKEKEMFDQLSKAQPVGRMGTPEEVATLVLYLCSDEAAFVTGAAYPIDGGATSLIWGAQP